jgi:hypothetical protein
MPTFQKKYTVSTFRAEDEDSMFVQNAGIYPLIYMMPKPTSSSPEINLHHIRIGDLNPHTRKQSRLDFNYGVSVTNGQQDYA